jgi:hypothetical protein
MLKATWQPSPVGQANIPPSFKSPWTFAFSKEAFNITFLVRHHCFLHSPSSS